MTAFKNNLINLITIMSKKNRRTLLFILLVYCVGTSLKGHAQILIPQVGVTFAKSNLASKDVSPYGSDVSFKTGLVAGMGIEFSLSKRWALNSGLFYIQKGSMSHHEIHEGSLTWINQLTFSHEYIDLPVTAKLKFGTSSAF